VLPDVHVAGRQVVQLDPSAGPSQRSLGGGCVDGQCNRGTGVVDAEEVPAGLVIDHDEPIVAAVVDPVDAAEQGGVRGLDSDGPLDPERLFLRVIR
jgi:hypothetical protein